jgi:hypothetical protein
VFLHDVWTILKDGQLTDPLIVKLLEAEVAGFKSFTAALSAAGLDANSRQKKSAPGISSAP